MPIRNANSRDGMALGQPEIPQPFLAAGNDVCADSAEDTTKAAADSEQWRDIDPNIPATDWTPEQKTINDSVAPKLAANPDARERLGRESGNPILEGFAVLGAQYRRAFVSALPNYCRLRSKSEQVVPVEK
ncbi:hypothetical protein K1X22_14925 [Mycolicibacterium farcinogenes]|uniref:hypothetical protein n=1 Tax=Mycolicibacterium farcinogenes TaxID=1802 RepID=UPI001C8DCBF8|nr:hypothetical protein [Mycolicibacterium farcinogenes]QZH57657.1 hypothetical protein K1X22_14925 [Mycolicibacterium farcinogenes]